METKLCINVTITIDSSEVEEEEKVLCEGCNEEVPLSEISDVMEMYICNRCDFGEES